MKAQAAASFARPESGASRALWPTLLACRTRVPRASPARSHDGPMGAAGVKRLMRLGMVEKVPGMGALDMNTGGWVGGSLVLLLFASP